MLDVSGDLALWYTGEEIVVFAFGSNTKVWRETVKCKKSKDPNFAYYCFGMLSPRQSKAVYRVTEGEYVLVIRREEGMPARIGDHNFLGGLQIDQHILTLGDTVDRFALPGR